MKFQLIVQGERGKYTRGDSLVIDLQGDTLEEAKKDAERQLVGEHSWWTSAWLNDYTGHMKLHVWLDGEDRLEHAPLLDEYAEHVYVAWIVTVAETVDLDALRTEIAAWTEQQRIAKTQDPDYQEYLRLQKKFG